MDTQLLRGVDKTSRKNYLISNLSNTRGFLFFVVLVVFATVFLPFEKSFQMSGLITLQFIAIGLISSVQIFLENRKHLISLNLMHWLFIYIFLFCAGIVQFSEGAFQWDFTPTYDEIVLSNSIIILWCLLYSFAYSFYRPTYRKNPTPVANLNYSYVSHAIITIVLMALAIITLLTVDFKAFFVRSIYEKAAINNVFGSSALSHLVISLIRGFSLWNSMVSLHAFKKYKRISFFFILVIAILCSLILVPPLAVARYVFACYYGGLAVFGISLFKKRNMFIYVFFIGLLILFPMLNAFRGLYTTNITSELIVSSVGNIKGNFATPDYDSYTMLVYTIRHCSLGGTTFGRQLLGVLLFFIPRDYWPSKPGGSGALIINTLAETNINSNVSCPLIAEGYINFGIFGVIIFCLVLVLFVKRIDGLKYNQWKSGCFVGSMFYCYLLLFSIFMFRGDLMSSFSTLIGYWVSFIVIRVLIYRKKEKISVCQ